jgi:hypothetical protein
MARERRREARVGVIGAVGMVREEIPGSEKVAMVELCPKESRSEVAPVRASVADGVDDAGVPVVPWRPVTTRGR